MTTRLVKLFTAAILAGATLAATPSLSPAAKGDCGQPVSSGSGPLSSDALAILKNAVGQAIAGCDDEPCICDVTGNLDVQASDALLTLKIAVGQDLDLNCQCGPPACDDDGTCEAGENNANCPEDCPCDNDGNCEAGETFGNCPNDCDPPPGIPCTSAELISTPGSDLDSGWTGIAHDSDLIEGATITFRTLRKCSNNQAACVKDSDCGGGQCEATCDCLGDTSCEVTGPTGPKYCVSTLVECDVNADCAAGVACVNTFGPPLPLSSDGNPVCVLTYFDGPLTGTADTDTGEAVTRANLKSRVFFGISEDRPCPRCGRLDQTPEIGDQFTCEGGQFNAAPCVVEGVSPDFGGVSRDCPPMLSANISGTGLNIRFSEVTTGTTTKNAQLPCSAFQFNRHPSRGNAKCNDKVGAADPLCTSNADCRRCTGDSTIACTSDGQCTGNGTCEEAPEQPVSCGYYCHCGFCNDNPANPCFDNADCPNGQTCVAGTGQPEAQNAPQKSPNDCSSDKFICGTESEEKCANSLQGKCELQDYRTCDTTADCSGFGAGECILDFRPCFESQITRTGDPSPLGSYCRDNRATCDTNGDCGANGPCVDYSSVPETVALFCVPATSSGAINSAGGLTGPGAVRLNSFVNVCRCGDNDIGCDEQCDDGNQTNGDGCDDYCQDE